MGTQIGIGGASKKRGGASSADAVSYDNSKSGFSATNVQDAIDEVGENLGGFCFEHISQDDYDNLPTKEPNYLYFITD